MAQKPKSAQQIATKMMKAGGDQARALKFAMGYGAGKALRNPRAVMQMAGKKK